MLGVGQPAASNHCCHAGSFASTSGRASRSLAAPLLSTIPRKPSRPCSRRRCNRPTSSRRWCPTPGRQASSRRSRTGRAIAATRGAGPRAASSASYIATGFTGSHEFSFVMPGQAREGAPSSKMTRASPICPTGQVALSSAGTRQLLCMGLFSIFW